MVNLAELLLETQRPFLAFLEERLLSQAYLNQSRFIIEEFARFCRDEGSDIQPWELRRRYLANRAALRSEQSFSPSYLENHGRELKRFLSWYRAQLATGTVSLGELSDEQLQSYWSTQPKALPYRRQMLKSHQRCLSSFLSRRWPSFSELDQASLLDEYFEERRLRLRGGGWGFVMRHRAGIVTRRVLEWLEREGHLPSGAAVAGSSELKPIVKTNEEELRHLALRVDLELPRGLREPLLDYLAHLVHERGLANSTIKTRLSTNRALCRLLAEQGMDSFGRLTVKQLDWVVSTLVTAPTDDLLRRRQQVRLRHSNLRDFLRYLYRRELIDRDLAAAMISPPCYRASKPAKVLSEKQVQTAVDSANRETAKGRRSYAILLLIASYGLRPVDVARLRLECFHWREERITLVQGKTGHPLTLPLLPEVAEAIATYLHKDRPLPVHYREVFLSLDWPHRPLRAMRVSILVKETIEAAGIPWAKARHLRASLATHLLRHQVPFGVIQDILGHRTPETTGRYAFTDKEMLRLVLEDSER